MNVHVKAELTTGEHEEFDAWIKTRGNNLISTVTIESACVTLRGGALGHVMSATAVRYPRRLTGALDEAFATLHQPRGSHCPAEDDHRSGRG